MFAVISRSRVTERIGKADDVGLQRSRGALDLTFSNREGISYAARRFQQGALKVRFPNVAKDEPPEAVIINTAGGLTDGDQLDIAMQVEAAAGATITSQACEKVYRAIGEPAEISVRLTLDAGAAMDWLPQPTIFFDGARLRRETQVTMAADARFMALESVIFGRAAMGETVEAGSLSDVWTIERGGRLVHVDRFVSGEEIGRMLGRATVLDGHRAMTTMRYVAPDASARLEEMRELLGSVPFPAAASAWDGLMVMRAVAPDSYCLNRELMRVLGAFRRRSMPRVWSI
ncbi:urease accessory protein UreD [Parvibaculum sp.]|uniref:urease accessory protein UreD n=1 Tax=Parvibaculum sp. TaxID=2024848 RepID=UPI002BC20314|nr:urease accessory protein UreD [Parvibaculum sp.]HUD50529.1 urease accessory protein UreD [Parvibaculum sp.]